MVQANPRQLLDLGWGQFHIRNLGIKVTDLTHGKQATLQKNHIQYCITQFLRFVFGRRIIHCIFFISFLTLNSNCLNNLHNICHLFYFESTKKITHKGNFKESFNVLLSMIRSCAQPHLVPLQYLYLADYQLAGDRKRREDFKQKYQFLMPTIST